MHKQNVENGYFFWYIKYKRETERGKLDWRLFLKKHRTENFSSDKDQRKKKPGWVVFNIAQRTGWIKRKKTLRINKSLKLNRIWLEINFSKTIFVAEAINCSVSWVSELFWSFFFCLFLVAASFLIWFAWICFGSSPSLLSTPSWVFQHPLGVAIAVAASGLLFSTTTWRVVRGGRGGGEKELPSCFFSRLVFIYFSVNRAETWAKNRKVSKRSSLLYPVLLFTRSNVVVYIWIKASS